VGARQSTGLITVSIVHINHGGYCVRRAPHHCVRWNNNSIHYPRSRQTTIGDLLSIHVPPLNTARRADAIKYFALASRCAACVKHGEVQNMLACAFFFIDGIDEDAVCIKMGAYSNTLLNKLF